MLHFSIKPASFQGIVRLGQKILTTSLNPIIIKTEFFRPFCISYLDQIIQHLDKDIKIQSTYGVLNQYLHQIRFPYLWEYARLDKFFPEENMIFLQRFKGNLDKLSYSVPFWLENEVLARPFIPDLSQKLTKKIVENLWEIVQNAFQHSRTLHGVSCCGQFYPECGYFEIAFYDHGVGISALIHSFNKAYQNFTDYECIEWATGMGNTTKPEKECGGMGLYYLSEFLKLNGGYLQIISHRGFYEHIGDAKSGSFVLSQNFQGTLFSQRIIYEYKVYMLATNNALV